MSRLGVLLVEDDDGDAMLVEDLLVDSALDVELVRCRSIGEALERLTGEVDCVLLDLGLPDGLGLGTLERLHVAAPRIAVIVLTGLDDEAAGAAAVDAGAQDYLVKGTVDSGLLARAIRYAVSRRHSEEVAQQLRVAELQAEENARLERGLVPHPILSNPDIWIAASYLPAGRRALLGGDFFDAVETDDGLVHLLVGDVSGRGPDAAALGAALRIAWRALTLATLPAEQIVAGLHRLAEHERQNAEVFATLCMVEIDPAARTLGLRRAGHPPPVLVAEDGVTSLSLEGGGPPIGMFAEPRWPESRTALPPAWSLLLYTDGLIEATVGRSTDRLGEDGLRRLVGDYVERDRGWRGDPHGLLRQLLANAEELNGGELSDDVAMLFVGARRGGATADGSA